MIHTPAMTREAHGAKRQGKLSGSMAFRLMSGSYRTWNTLLKDLRNPRPFYDVGPNTPAPLAWGKNHEDQALGLWWEKHPLLDLQNPVCVGYHNAVDLLWHRHTVVSPDRLIYDPQPRQVIAGLELKCPYTYGKLERWRAEGGAPEYLPQCAWGRLITGIPAWMFVAFDPRLPEGEQFFEAPVPITEAYLAKMHELGTAFLRVYESGGEFQPTNPTAKRFKELFSGQ